MINFSGISKDSLAGKILRFPLRLIPKDVPVFILQGPLRGYRWITGSGVFGYLLGSYEHEKQNIFFSLISPGFVVFDVGAHVGFYSLLAAKAAGKTGRIYSFEPSPRNQTYLKRHTELNGLGDRIKVFDVAVSDREGSASFSAGPSSFTGGLSENGDFAVRTTSLDSLFEKKEILSPSLIKMDVEGAEYLALQGMEKILKEFHPIILLATHGEEIKKKCLEFLSGIGYSAEALSGSGDEYLVRPI